MLTTTYRRPLIHPRRNVEVLGQIARHQPAKQAAPITKPGHASSLSGQGFGAVNHSGATCHGPLMVAWTTGGAADGRSANRTSPSKTPGTEIASGIVFSSKSMNVATAIQAISITWPAY